jgi:uncharacterized protein (TIGR03437 family)
MAAAAVLTAGLWAQGVPNPDWRRIGNAALELDLAGLATGPVERVWYSADGQRLLVQAPGGRRYQTVDFETWTAAADAAPPPMMSAVNRLPEGARFARGRTRTGIRQYAAGAQVWRSDDGGATWTNVTEWKAVSILGGDVIDLAVSPRDEEELVAAGKMGLWRSVDGGKSWSGLNDGLPNLPVRGVTQTGGGTTGLRVSLEGIEDFEVEWAPGEKRAWKPVAPLVIEAEREARRWISAALGGPISAAGSSGGYVYAGDGNGRLWVSTNAGAAWSGPFETGGGEVEALFVDGRDPRVALASLDAKPGGPRVLRTLNGGAFWDDLTANLPEGGARGVAADVETGAIYVATDRGLFHTSGSLTAAGPATPWALLSASLPAARVMDVKLDPAGNQLFVALEGYGVYAAMAPHRARNPKVVSAADLVGRAAAPGTLLSVLGAKVDGARAGQWAAPVLANTESESQIQVPFEVTGSTLALALESRGGALTIPLALGPVSPGLFVDRDGSPMILDADSGILLDAMNPARSGSRVQVLATGLGKVRPDWPTGLAAPLDSPPQVVAPVRVYVDRAPVEVKRATLAPGYIGFYLVEVQMPDIVNAGPAELYMEAAGVQSNRVRLYLEP